MRRFLQTASTLAFVALGTQMAAADILPAGHRRPFFGRSAPCRTCPTCPSCPTPAQAPAYAPPGDQPPAPRPGEEGPTETPTAPMPMPSTPDAMPEAAAAPVDSADMPSFSNLAFAEQGMGGGAGTMILGRADSMNRFNLFDNMSAEPTSRMWFSYLLANGLNPQVPANPALGRPDLHVYRFGFEHAFSSLTSFAAQAMYNTYSNTGDGIGALEDSWSNPQFMLKRVLWRGEYTTVAATIGFEAEIGTEASTINESYSRWQPGVLAFHNLENDMFFQGGAQLSIPTDDHGTTTADWVVSLGKWFYRDESLDGLRRRRRRLPPWIVGVTGQIEVLGKHVTGDATIENGFFVEETIQPNGPSSFEVVNRFFDYEEARNVVDLTLGTNIMFRNNTALGLGFSFPITGSEVRESEGIISYNYFY